MTKQPPSHPQHYRAGLITPPPENQHMSASTIPEPEFDPQDTQRIRAVATEMIYYLRIDGKGNAALADGHELQWLFETPEWRRVSREEYNAACETLSRNITELWGKP